jgi:hypothetical protein
MKEDKNIGIMTTLKKTYPRKDPTPWARSTRLAKVLLECRRIGHRKTGPVDEERPVASPPSRVIGGRLADRGCPTPQQLPDDER